MSKRTYLKYVFMPTSNRHFTGKKLSLLSHALGYAPSVAIAVLAAIFYDYRFGLVALAIMAYATATYVLFDRVADTLSWNAFWKRFYDEKPVANAAHHDAMKQYEQNPTPENLAALRHRLK